MRMRLLVSISFAGEAAGPRVVPWWLSIPFMMLLMTIALAPFISRRWWEQYYPAVSFGLGAAVVAYYGLFISYLRMAETFLDYFSFIVLIGSLFVAAGGIYLHTERRATPMINTLLLAAGAVAANVLGTTGASMLLIRPFIRINRMRIRGYHIAFFIFMVSNIGGALTPIGDPPLFLGYLYGVPFRWTLVNVWYVWLLGIAIVLAVFYVVDSLSYRRWVERTHHPVHGARIELMGIQNFFFLFVILTAVFARTPIRELIMIASAAAAHRFAKKDALSANQFTFTPITEVAILFAGIFATMVPALDWLSLNADRLGIRTPGEFFWTSGTLSSFLDNTPTYLNFLSAALGLHALTIDKPADVLVLAVHDAVYLRAISVGAVFFGALTYIGNGPNFMVKSIAEHAGVECPSFFGYVFRYSFPILIPIFVVIWLLFFH